MPEVANKTNNLSIPSNTPMVDNNGRLTQPWLIWFNNLYKRVGSSVALNNVDLENLNNQTNDNLATIANELLKSIQENAENILNIGEKIEDFENDVEALKDIVAQLTVDVASNTSNIVLNTENILQNTADIAENTADIIELQEEVNELIAGGGGLEELKDIVEYIDRTYINEFINLGTEEAREFGIYDSRLATGDPSSTGVRQVFLRTIKAGQGMYIEPLEVTNQSVIKIVNKAARNDTELRGVTSGTDSVELSGIYGGVYGNEDYNNMLVPVGGIWMATGQFYISGEGISIYNVTINAVNRGQTLTFLTNSVVTVAEEPGAISQGLSLIVTSIEAGLNDIRIVLTASKTNGGDITCFGKLRIIKDNTINNTFEYT